LHPADAEYAKHILRIWRTSSQLLADLDVIAVLN
jgi:hypothetical protein